MADALLASLMHEDPLVRDEAVASLRERGEEVVAPLVHALVHRRDEKVKREAADALVIVGSPATSARRHVLTHDRNRIRPSPGRSPPGRWGL